MPLSSGRHVPDFAAVGAQARQGSWDAECPRCTISNDGRKASYFSIPIDEDKSADETWTCKTLYSAVTEIKDYLAFQPSRVDTVEQRDAGGSLR